MAKYVRLFVDVDAVLPLPARSFSHKTFIAKRYKIHTRPRSYNLYLVLMYNVHVLPSNNKLQWHPLTVAHVLPRTVRKSLSQHLTRAWMGWKYLSCSNKHQNSRNVWNCSTRNVLSTSLSSLLLSWLWHNNSGYKPTGSSRKSGNITNWLHSASSPKQSRKHDKG